MTYVFAAAAVCGVFVLAGWRGRSAKRLTAGNAWTGFPEDPLWADNDGDAAAPGRQADVAGAIRAAINRLSPVLAQRPGKLEIAAPPGLRVRMEAAVLADLMQEALAVATDRAPASQILVTAARHGDRVYIGITDDSPGPNPPIQHETLRDLAARVALLGGALDVNAHATEGTTMTLRLAVAFEERQEIEIQPVTERPKVVQSA